MAGNKYSKKAFVILCAAIVVFTLAGCKKETPAPDSEDETVASPSEVLVVEPSEALVIELGVGVGPVKFGMSYPQNSFKNGSSRVGEVGGVYESVEIKKGRRASSSSGSMGNRTGRRNCDIPPSISINA